MLGEACRKGGKTQRLDRICTNKESQWRPRRENSRRHAPNEAACLEDLIGVTDVLLVV
jgi:hypothetical protein